MHIEGYQIIYGSKFLVGLDTIELPIEYQNPEVWRTTEQISGISMLESLTEKVNGVWSRVLCEIKDGFQPYNLEHQKVLELCASNALPKGVTCFEPNVMCAGDDMYAIFDVRRPKSPKVLVELAAQKDLDGIFRYVTDMDAQERIIKSVHAQTIDDWNEERFRKALVPLCLNSGIWTISSTSVEFGAASNISHIHTECRENTELFLQNEDNTFITVPKVEFHDGLIKVGIYMLRPKNVSYQVMGSGAVLRRGKWRPADNRNTRSEMTHEEAIQHVMDTLQGKDTLLAQFIEVAHNRDDIYFICNKSGPAYHFGDHHRGYVIIRADGQRIEVLGSIDYNTSRGTYFLSMVCTEQEYAGSDIKRACRRFILSLQLQK